MLRGAFFDDDTVGHEDDLIGDVAGEGHLVGDDHHRDVEVLQGLDDLQDFAGELRVEGAGRLIEEKNLRVQRQGAGDGDALLLSAGELVRIVLLLIGESHLLEELTADLLCLCTGLLLHVDDRVCHILQHIPVRKEVKLLEDEAVDLLDLPECFLIGVCCTPVGSIVRNHRILILQRAGVHRFEQGGTAKQGGLAGARRTDDRHDLAIRDGQADIPEDLEVTEAFLDVFHFEQIHRAPPYL